nr:MAG TPA: hypothetical protein [Caudoviricetes sp.]
MEDVIRKYLCSSCLNKRKKCMKYTEEIRNGIKKYKCNGYIYSGEKKSYDIFTYKIRSDE